MRRLYLRKPKEDSKKKLRLAGLLVILLGVGVFLFFFFPVISYQLFLSGQYARNKIEVPIPKYLVVKQNNSVGSLISSGVNSLTSDFTDARNWYPNLTGQAEAKNFTKERVASYLLSIPKLKIEDAQVSTVDYDLEKHMVQYLGTSIPGENGTAVIFGHSTIPYLFNPKNYKTIFATLHTLKIGDEIYTTVAGIKYKYKVFSILITDPEDTNILSQSYDHSYITLVTCTPPGTIWKRLIVRASLESAVNPALDPKISNGVN